MKGIDEREIEKRFTKHCWISKNQFYFCSSFQLALWSGVDKRTRLEYPLLIPPKLIFSGSDSDLET